VDRRGVVARAAAALAIGATVLVPVASEAGPLQESGSDSGDSSAEAALVDVDIEVERADQADIAAAFSDVRANVEAQRAALAQAEQAVATADFVLVGAEAKVAETQGQIDVLVGQADVVVVNAFVSPGSETAVDIMETRDATEASMKQALLDIYAEADADILAALDEANNELEQRQDLEEEAADAAERSRDDAAAALVDLRAAVSQEVAFAADIEDRLERNLAEADALSEIDPAMAEQLRAQQGALAMQVADSRQRLEQEEVLAAAGVAADEAASSGPSTIEPVSGGVVEVSCPSGGAIEVAGEIARDVQGLLNRAWEQGVSMCGNGFRDPSEQVALRRRNCGSSSYAIYEAPASACSPPTAPPGSSMHEQGLAIDFTSGGDGAISCGGEAYDFLDDNAADFGFYNLPGECWHWSTNGQ
jgi:LAS superfamily LD-carboxypeptidase LdcB